MENSELPYELARNYHLSYCQGIHYQKASKLSKKWGEGQIIDLVNYRWNRQGQTKQQDDDEEDEGTEEG